MAKETEEINEEINIILNDILLNQNSQIKKHQYQKLSKMLEEDYSSFK